MHPKIETCGKGRLFWTVWVLIWIVVFIFVQIKIQRASFVTKRETQLMHRVKEVLYRFTLRFCGSSFASSRRARKRYSAKRISFWCCSKAFYKDNKCISLLEQADWLKGVVYQQAAGRFHRTSSRPQFPRSRWVCFQGEQPVQVLGDSHPILPLISEPSVLLSVN